VPRDRSRRDHVFLAERGFDATTIEMAFGAIALHATRRPGKPSAIIALQRVVDRQGIFAVGARRGLSRQVAVHADIIASASVNEAVVHISPHGKAAELNSHVLEVGGQTRTKKGSEHDRATVGDRIAVPRIRSEQTEYILTVAPTSRSPVRHDETRPQKTHYHRHTP
jgi:hypothetical protein